MACIHNLFQWNWVQAEAELRKAIELNPNYYLAHQWYSFTLLRVGQPEQAVSEMRLALSIDPLSLQTNLAYEGRLLAARQYQDAVSHALAVIELYPDNVELRKDLAEAYEHTGRLDKARQEFDKFVAGTEAGRSLRTTCKSLNYSQCKQQFVKLEAKTTLDELETKRQKGQYTSPAEYAQAYLQLGEKGKAMHWLELAYEHGCSIMLDLNLPMFDELRSETAFQELVGKVGLPRARKRGTTGLDGRTAPPD